MVSAHKPKRLVLVVPDEAGLSLPEKLARRQRVRVEAYLEFKRLAHEVERLDYESGPLNELLDGRLESFPDRQAGYQKALDEICARERELFPLVRTAAMCFFAADAAVISAGGHGAYDFHKNNVSPPSDGRPHPLADALHADPLYEAGLRDYECDIDGMVSCLADLGRSYPELA